MGELSKLVNIGKELEKQLNDVGVYSYDDLLNLGCSEAWLKIKQIDPTSCINKLYALEGALQKVRWHDLSKECKEYLKEFYEKNK